MNKAKTQEIIDRLVTGSPILDSRDAVGVAFRNYERSISAVLKSACDRDWQDEDLYTVAQITANAVTYRDRTIAQLKKECEELKAKVDSMHSWSWEYSPSSVAYTVKPLVFSEDENIPCNATLEVKVEKLAKYFDKRAKENQKRASSEEKLPCDDCTCEPCLQHERSGYYFSGKADTYTRAAEKVRELLG